MAAPLKAHSRFTGCRTLAIPRHSVSEYAVVDPGAANDESGRVQPAGSQQARSDRETGRFIYL
ncbi:hypothetical protein, partial [Alistipes sp.]|uniref:hypothetical protein n=1 Tax=Alistipes sp. TaxID=1872444 RepID=UPI003AB0A79F